MSESRIGTQLGKAKKFSNFRCVKCHSYLILLTEQKTDLFDFTPKQKEKVRQHGLTHFCPRCSRGYQRTEKPLSQESENCPYYDSELSFVKYEEELIPILWCQECEKAFLAEKEDLKKIRKYAKKTKQPLSKEVTRAMEESE